MALTASHKTFIDSVATEHMVKDVSLITGKAGKRTIKAMAQRKSVMKLTARVKPAMLNRVLHVADVEHDLVSVPTLCRDDHMVEFRNSKWVAKKKKKCVAGLGERVGGMHSVRVKRTSDKTFLTLDVIGDTFSDWRSRMAHRD